MLDRAAAVRLVTEILQAAPESRFSASGGECVYFDPNGYPVCAIGYVFEKVGIGLADLAPIYAMDNPNGSRVEELRFVWEGKISETAVKFLQEVQDVQDLSFSWGEVYRRVVLEAPEEGAAE